ncbi:MAG: hypothetical protein Q4D48_01355 [Coriobacteriales bacterium]|nr:hypothetical protein [Coriobacteriales bacterium]
MVWIQFFIATAAATLVVMLPGLGLLMLLGSDHIESCCLAPSVSVALIAVLCIAYGELGLFANWQTVLLPLCIISVLLLAISLIRVQRSTGMPKHDAGKRRESRVLLLYLMVAFAVSVWFFVRTLNGPSSFSQEHDNLHHLLIIKGFLETGDLSTLHVNAYATKVMMGEMTPTATGQSFYPSAWYDVAALVASLVRCDVAMAQNATILVFLALVAPLSSYVFLSWLFSENRVALLSGAVLSLAFSAFPWQLLIFGTLYPNFGGYCLILAASFAFVRMVESEKIQRKAAYALIFLLSGVALGFMHPNAVFSTAILLFPYCLFTVHKAAALHAGTKAESPAKRWIPTALFAALFVVVWVVLYKAPALQRVVTFNWPPFSSIRGQLLNVILLAFKTGHAQPLLSILVLMGLISCVHTKRFSWLSLSYSLSFVICFYNGIAANSLRNLLSGFWYNDQYRIAATMALVCLPLACLGSSLLWDVVQRIGRALAYLEENASWGMRGIASFLIMLSVCLYLPTLQLPDGRWYETAFGAIEDSLRKVNDMTSIMAPEEYEFMAEVAQTVEQGALIINQPHDGSVFGHIVYDLNLYYLLTSTPSVGYETFESRMVRTGLNKYATSFIVHDTVNSLDADYVLLLDLDGKRSDDRYWYGHYYENDWVGINAVTDDTPGFEVVLSRGDMRLYRVVRYNTAENTPTLHLNTEGERTHDT